jgi:hypothetical protein
VEIFVEYFDKIVYGLQIRQTVVVDVHTNAKVKTRIATIDDFKIAELKRPI